jgi:hypothetical protein
MLSAIYIILLNIFLLGITLCVDKMYGDHHWKFRHNRSINDQITCICQIWDGGII